MEFFQCSAMLHWPKHLDKRKCLKEGSIIIPPYAPPQKMQAHLIPLDTPRSIFVYFRGLFYDNGNDPEGGYYARFVKNFLCYTLEHDVWILISHFVMMLCRGARASLWENFKNNPLFDISTDHPSTYYEDMSAQSCACVHWDGHHGAQGWWRPWFSAAFQSS